MPDSLAAGTTPSTLKSRRCSLKGEVAKSTSDKTARISCKLGLFAGGVPIAQNHEIDLRRRVAHFLDRNQARRRACIWSDR